MAVYDDEKQRTDSGISDDELRQLTGIGEDEEDAMDREAHNGAADDILSREEEASRGSVPWNPKVGSGDHRAMEKVREGNREIKEKLRNTENRSGDFGFREEGGGQTKGLRSKLGRLNKKRKRLLIAAGAGGALLLGILAILAFFLGSLLIPNFVSSVATYQFARVTRETLNTQTKATAQKVAIDSATDNVYRQAKAKYEKLRNNTWGKLDKYRPAKVMKNLKATKKLDYQYGEPSKVLKRARIVKVIIDGKSYEVKGAASLGDIRNPIKYVQAKIQTRIAINTALKGALRGSNFLVRSKVAKQIRAELKVKLFAWSKADKEKLRNSNKTTQDVLNAQKSYQTATNSGTTSAKASQGTKSDDIKETAEKASDAQDACYKDAKCTEETVKKGGGLSQKAVAAIESTVGESAFNKVLNVISPAYAVAVPICLVYDGSTVNSADTIDTNNDQLQRSFNRVSSAGDQQERGEAPAEGIGALSRQLGQTGRSIPQQRASGVPVDTTESFSPQASAGGSYEHNILDALFPTIVADLISPTLDKACPVITDPVVGGILAGLNIIPGVGAGLQAAGQVTTRVIARTIATSVGNVVRNMFTKKSLQQITTTTVATVGATLLARLIVMQHMGAVTDGTAQGTMYADQIDMGGNINAQELDRKQNMGAPLTNQSVSQLRSIDQEFTRSQFASQSFFNRYFSITNPGSFMNRLAVTTGTHFNLQSLSSTMSSLPQILNPMNILTKLGNIFHPFGKVSAASEVDKENYGNVQWGWTAAQEKAFTSDPKYEMLANQEALDDSGKEEDIQEDYGKCFEKSIGQLLADGDIIRDANGNIVYDEGDCSPENLGMDNPDYGDLVFRWRVAMRYSLGVDELLNQQEIN